MHNTFGFINAEDINKLNANETLKIKLFFFLHKMCLNEKNKTLKLYSKHLGTC